MKEEDDAMAVTLSGEDEGTRGHVTAPHAKPKLCTLTSGADTSGYHHGRLIRC